MPNFKARWGALLKYASTNNKLETNYIQGTRKTVSSKYLPCLVRQTQKLPNRSEFGVIQSQFLSTANWTLALQNTTLNSLSSLGGGYKQAQF